jgi:transcriptional regulator with XRE-family HTH domain
MTRANGNRRRGRSLGAKEVATILRQAFAHCLNATGMSRERAARDMGVTRYTVQRYLSGKSEVNAKFVLRSGALWRPFWLCVSKLAHQARKAP